MNYLIYTEATGEIVGMGGGSALAELPTAETGTAVMEGTVADISQWYVAEGVLYEIPARPSVHHVWVWATKEWSDPRTLEDRKAMKIRVLKAGRDAFLHAGFTWDGSAFDSDMVSQTRLLGLKVKAQGDPGMSELWRLADNTWRSLSAADALAVWAAFEEHLRGAFFTFAALEAEVLAATNVAEIDAVTWA